MDLHEYDPTWPGSHVGLSAGLLWDRMTRHLSRASQGLQTLLGSLIATSAFMAVACGHGSSAAVIPSQLILDDYQRPLDRRLTESLVKLERMGLPKAVFEEFVSPFLGEMESLEHASAGVRIQPGALPDRPEILRAIEECARILHLPSPPEVFVVDRLGAGVSIAVWSDPAILLHSPLLRRFQDPDELRFIIGRAMGHITCGHGRLLALKDTLGALLPSSLEDLSIGPLFQWIYEAEMSADRAGLLCAQDLPAAERALMKMLLDVDDTAVGTIEVDLYLDQTEPPDWSNAAELVHALRELEKPHPFIPQRIRELREYASSPFYLRIWD